MVNRPQERDRHKVSKYAFHVYNDMLDVRENT